MGNDDYSLSGFLGRATGFDAGAIAQGDTHSRGGIYAKFRLPKLRDLTLYQEILGEDHEPGGLRFLPFKAVSFQGGFYLPRVTADGRTDLRLEYALIESNYSTHFDSLYWTNQNDLMGDPLGPNASEFDLQAGHWFRNLTKASADLFLTQRAPKQAENVPWPEAFYGTDLAAERSIGLAFDLLTIPESPALRADVLSFGKGHFAVEYVDHLNFGPSYSIRGVVSMTIGLKPRWDGLVWQ